MSKTTYHGKVRTKHKVTHKVKYFNAIEDVTSEFEVVSICSEHKSTQNKDAVYYKDMYKKLIAYRLKNRLPELFDNELQHHHHIYPKSIFGKNYNVVLLTVFEHCLAHYYLFKMYKCAGKKDETKKMGCAYNGLRLACGYQYDGDGSKQFMYAKAKVEKMISQDASNDHC